VRIDKANNWCAQGRDLLASQHIDKCSCSPEIAEQLLYEIEHFMEVGINELNINLNTHNSRDFYAMFEDAITPETKALVNQVSHRRSEPFIRAAWKRLARNADPILIGKG
jgi:hypothetical protein